MYRSKKRTIRFNGRWVECDLEYEALYLDHIIYVYRTNIFQYPVIGYAKYLPNNCDTFTVGDTVKDVKTLLDEWVEMVDYYEGREIQ